MLRFLITFCVLYYGTIAMIGITSPDGLYSPFLAKYLDYVSWLRSGLLHCSIYLTQALGYPAFISDIYTIKLKNGLGVHVGYDCIGYGVLFFWVAFLVANAVPWKTKLKWLLGGVLVIWCINVVRISMLLIAINQKWSSPFNLDNHTLFNIAAYLAIFTMIYLFDQSEKKRLALTDSQQHA